MNDAERKPTTTLLGDALDQTVRLVRGEIDLAKAEMKTALHSGMIGAGMILAGALLAGVAVQLLAAAAVAALVESGFSATAATLIVAVVLVAVAIALVLAGTATLRAISNMPARTARRLARDAETLKEGMTDDRHRR